MTRSLTPPTEEEMSEISGPNRSQAGLFLSGECTGKAEGGHPMEALLYRA